MSTSKTEILHTIIIVSFNFYLYYFFALISLFKSWIECARKGRRGVNVPPLVKLQYRIALREEWENSSPHHSTHSTATRGLSVRAAQEPRDTRSQNKVKGVILNCIHVGVFFPLKFIFFSRILFLLKKNFFFTEIRLIFLIKKKIAARLDFFLLF